MIQHSVHRPPRSVEIFNLEDYRKISEYFLNTFYQNYKLYQYTFSKKQVANVKMVTCGHIISQPFSCKLLSGSISDEEWQQKKKMEMEAKQMEEAKRLEEQQKLEREIQEAERKKFEEEEEMKAKSIIEKLHPKIKEKLDSLKQSLEQYTAERFGDVQKLVQNMLEDLAKTKKK